MRIPNLHAVQLCEKAKQKSNWFSFAPLNKSADNLQLCRNDKAPGIQHITALTFQDTVSSDEIIKNKSWK